MGQYRSEERQADGCSVALIPSQSAVIERAERKRQASMENLMGGVAAGLKFQGPQYPLLSFGVNVNCILPYASPLRSKTLIAPRTRHSHNMGMTSESGRRFNPHCISRFNSPRYGESGVDRRRKNR